MHVKWKPFGQWVEWQSELPNSKWHFSTLSVKTERKSRVIESSHNRNGSEYLAESELMSDLVILMQLILWIHKTSKLKNTGKAFFTY